VSEPGQDPTPAVGLVLRLAQAVVLAHPPCTAFHGLQSDLQSNPPMTDLLGRAVGQFLALRTIGRNLPEVVLIVRSGSSAKA
jgi:hypothetical protein